MYSLSKIIVLLSVALSVSAIPSHFARDPNTHHHLAARVPSPDPIVDPMVVVEQRAAAPPRRRKRSLNRRCVPRPGNESSSSPSSSSSSTPKVTDPASPTVAPSDTTSKTSTPTPSSKIPAATPSSKTPAPTSTSETPIATSTSEPPTSDKTSTSTSSTASPTSDSGSSSSSGSSSTSFLSQTFSGDGTFYATGLGACGITNNDSQFIAAVSQDFFDTFPGYTGGDPNNNPLCGKQITASYGGKSVTVALTDRCTACAYGALDFSPAAFAKLADLSVGRINNVQWHFI